MRQLARLPVLAAAAWLAGGCYMDDTTAPPALRAGLASVLLTDAPFPYDSVASVNIYVVRIEANVEPDTSGDGAWVVITEPKKAFDLLKLQQGVTAIVGAGELPAGQYRAIRMTIDTSRSSIVWTSGSKARVNWQNWSGSNEMPLYALVEYPVNVPTDGAEIVIDFDLGRSFLFDFFGTREFTLMPQLRAINSAATGTIAGTVTSAYTGQTAPVRNAAITVYGGIASRPETWYVVATGRSDDSGGYKVAFVRAGTYQVQIERPDYPFLASLTDTGVVVTAGATTIVSASLPEAGSSARVRISGADSVGVGGRVALFAAVWDASGARAPGGSVTWTSSDTTVATVAGVPGSDSALVTGRSIGYATITATSDTLQDTLRMAVVPPPAPVATVAVVPATQTINLPGDSVWFRVELRDDAGNLLYNRPVTWFTPDSAVIWMYPYWMYPYGSGALVRPRAAGTAKLRATSEGKSGEATITVQ
jgi:hypothetical protein